MEPKMTVDSDGNKFWYLSGRRHREDGPAVEWVDGDREWWIDGLLQRLDGPAIEYTDGFRSWWQNGLRHRLDGPAVEYADGRQFWYINGEEIDEFTHWYLSGVKNLNQDVNILVD